MPGKNWTREELIVALNLYCTIPFGTIHNKNPRIINLAAKLGRTPSSVSWKLANFSRLDPKLKERGIEGASHGSKLEIEIWEEFYASGEELIFQSETLLAGMGTANNSLVDFNPDMDIQDTERERIVKTRVNQDFFRRSILAIYNNKCCITNIGNPELLHASHIVPWSIDKANRVNPRNGLCLNVLHDKAFDRGLMTVTPDYIVKVSPLIEKDSELREEWFERYNGRQISLPASFLPDREFLDYHASTIYRG